MNNELTELNITDGIYDIYPPISPGFNVFEVFLISTTFLLILCIITYILWSRFYSAKAISRRNIKKLQAEYLSRKVNSRDAAYQLAFFLKQGLKTTHIGKNTSLPYELTEYNDEWNTFKDNLSNLRYKNAVKPDTNISALFKSSLDWLKIWP